MPRPPPPPLPPAPPPPPALPPSYPHPLSLPSLPPSHPLFPRSLSFVYPYGATLTVQKPAIAVLSSGSTSYPLSRPVAAFYTTKVWNGDHMRKEREHGGREEGKCRRERQLGQWHHE